MVFVLLIQPEMLIFPYICCCGFFLHWPFETEMLSHSRFGAIFLFVWRIFFASQIPKIILYCDFLFQIFHSFFDYNYNYVTLLINNFVWLIFFFIFFLDIFSTCRFCTATSRHNSIMNGHTVVGVKLNILSKYCFE